MEARIEGRDLPMGGPPSLYRRAVAEIAANDEVRGALVTTHKVDVFRHAGGLFAELDEDAVLCREVSSISKRGPSLVGHAKDPITAGKSIERILGGGSMPEEVVCLGGGGAGTAISVYLLRRDPPPRRVVLVDRDAARIDDLRSIHSQIGSSASLAYVVNDDAVANDSVLKRASEGALVINATGMGKDTPGSPLTPRATFPKRAVVWELNYRGELDYLRQARAQVRERQLRVHDGWDYFLYGWSEVISEVFSLDVDDACFEELKEAAAPLRP